MLPIDQTGQTENISFFFCSKGKREVEKTEECLFVLLCFCAFVPLSLCPRGLKRELRIEKGLLQLPLLLYFLYSRLSRGEGESNEKEDRRTTSFASGETGKPESQIIRI